MNQTANPAILGDRVAFWLRANRLSAKEVARLVDASEGTGKRLRAGIPPTTEQMTRLSGHFGWRFILFVFEAVIGPDDATLAADLNEINRRLERLEGGNDDLGRKDDAARPYEPRALARDQGRGLAGMAPTPAGTREVRR